VIWEEKREERVGPTCSGGHWPPAGACIAHFLRATLIERRYNFIGGRMLRAFSFVAFCALSITDE
jgi:hypothetical protein